MSDHFKIGDVVVCVNDDDCPVRLTKSPYRKGAIYRVTAIRSGFNDAGQPATGIKCVGFEHHSYRHEVCFRHLPKADPGFIEQMKRLPAPARQKEDA